MKKVISLLTALLLAASMLAGCSSSENKPSAESTNPTTEATSEPATESTTEAPEDLFLKPAELGVVRDNTYLCPFSGFGCTFPEDAAVSAGEELKPLTDSDKKELVSTQLRNTMLVTQIMDMQAILSDGSTNASVIYQELNATDYKLFVGKSEKEFLDTLLLAQKSTMMKSYENAGFIVESLEAVDTQFMGESHPALECRMNLRGVDMVILQYFRPVENSKFFVLVTLTATSEERLADLQEMFYKLDEHNQPIDGPAISDTPDTPDTQPQESSDQPLLGTVDGQTYTNYYTGFGFTLSDDFELIPADQLQTLTEDLTELVASTGWGNHLPKQVMTVKADSVKSGVSLNLLYQAKTAAQEKMSDSLTEEEVIKSMMIQKDQIIASYKQMGAEAITIEPCTVEFLGKTHTGMMTTLEMQGRTLYMKQLVNFQTPGSYAYTLTCSGTTEADVDAVLACFYPLSE